MTNTARYTSGPWLPGIKDGDVEPVIAGGVPIAEMIPTHCTEEEFEANCSLVHAAPELLDALEAICNHTMVNLADADDLTETDSELWDQALVAIAKARGRTTAASDMQDPLSYPELKKAHDTLSELLEDEDAGNDEIRDAAIDMRDALNAFWLQRDAPTTKPTCADRAQWAEKAVTAYARAKEGRVYDLREDMASDLFTDLCHLFLREGVSPERMMERARTHYQEERAEEGREI
jgi:cellobiose-specific phosphotransferase system component IIA